MHNKLLNSELLDIIVPKIGLIDCTFGGGHMSLPFFKNKYNVYLCDINEKSYFLAKLFQNNYKNIQEVYLGTFQSFIDKISIDADVAIIDLGLSDYQINNDFSYKSDKIRFHLHNRDEKVIKMLNTSSMNNFKGMFKKYGGVNNHLNSITKKLISNRPYKNNKDIYNVTQKDSKFVFYSLFNYANSYLEKICTGIVKLLTLNITVYVFCFNNIEITRIRKLKFHFNCFIEEVELDCKKSFSRLFKIIKIC